MSDSLPSDFAIRKITIQIEEILHEGGPLAETPPLRGAVYAICANPFAGRYQEDLLPAMDALKPLALLLTDRLVAAMGGRDRIDAYGKGAIVGEAGESEHGAIWHVAGGYGMRERLGECRAIVPSAMKVGGMGSTLDIPLGHLNAAYVRSRFDVITVTCEDGPRAGEVLFALAMARGGRIHSRMGGLEMDQVKGEDGLR
ncbi:amino acid synthesis family protein [Pseudotabrizicola sediminis]|uniref:Amino acid synthesis family protein n=1 Tax=Pseudotabrizicola sediminis TaxID=2486418 RepID=A0ABY2KLA1_9RHOB|nr:amino acid synthesis family protein [Pseudotabrizicola sediminis]TGD43292.1 amino acid synthesis family protein [Pseudotabrizicola sediminis]